MVPITLWVSYFSELKSYLYYARNVRRSIEKLLPILIIDIGPHTFDIEEEVEEDEDFLAASWASSKTVCSDAFDFLFDEKNMNPENVLEKHQDVIEIKPDKNFGKPIMDNNHSKCCVIS